MTPRIVVCEDGTEYHDRFHRFFGAEFQFVRAGNLGEALACCAGSAGLILDLDFSRTVPGKLVDEAGAAGVANSPPDEIRRLAEVQGIFLLRALRKGGITVPALLFADLDDPERVGFLEQTLAPLSVVPSSESLTVVGGRLRAWR